MNRLTPQTHISHPRFSRRPATGCAVGALVAATVFATVMTGCSSKQSEDKTAASGTTAATTSPGATPDAAQLLEESAKTTKTTKTIHLALTTTNLPDLPMETVNADVTNEPKGDARATGDAKIRLQPGAPVQPFTFLVTNKTMYTKGPDGKWNVVGPAQKIYDPNVILSKDKGLANVLSKIQNPKVDSKESIDGVATVKISGTIDASAIDPVVPKLGEGGGTLPITVWIADVPARTSPTSVPKDAPSSGNGPNLVRFVVNKDQGNVQVTFSNWAKPVDIPNPTG